MYVNRLLKEFFIEIIIYIDYSKFLYGKYICKKKNDFIYVAILNIYINMYIV